MGGVRWGWVDLPVLSYDCEATGVEVESDHVLSASMAMLTPGEPARVETEWINPGVPIPAGATAVNGITDAQIQALGGPPQQGLETICLLLAAALRDGIPLVGMNLVYDLTLLDRNCRRHGVTPLSDRAEICPVIDVYVLDKQVDRFRKGKGMRKLEAIGPIYRVDLGRSHSSADDALSAARIAWRIGRLYPPVGELDAVELHHLQVGWKRKQDTDFAAYLKREGKDATGVDGQWPIRLPGATTATSLDDEDQLPLWE